MVRIINCDVKINVIILSVAFLIAMLIVANNASKRVLSAAMLDVCYA